MTIDWLGGCSQVRLGLELYALKKYILHQWCCLNLGGLFVDTQYMGSEDVRIIVKDVVRAKVTLGEWTRIYGYNIHLSAEKQ